MIWINTEDVICIHNRIIEKTKGIEGIRDLHGLEAAIAAPLQTFSGQDLFPTDTEKIARLGAVYKRQVLRRYILTRIRRFADCRMSCAGIRSITVKRRSIR